MTNTNYFQSPCQFVAYMALAKYQPGEKYGRRQIERQIENCNTKLSQYLVLMNGQELNVCSVLTLNVSCF